MPKHVAYSVMAIACTYMVVFDVIFMFPFSLPVSASTMNYSRVMTGGITIFLGRCYLWKRSHGYEGPRVVLEARNDLLRRLVEDSNGSGKEC